MDRDNGLGLRVQSEFDVVWLTGYAQTRQIRLRPMVDEAPLEPYHLRVVLGSGSRGQLLPNRKGLCSTRFAASVGGDLFVSAKSERIFVEIRSSSPACYVPG